MKPLEKVPWPEWEWNFSFPSQGAPLYRSIHFSIIDWNWSVDKRSSLSGKEDRNVKCRKKKFYCHSRYAKISKDENQNRAHQRATHLKLDSQLCYLEKSAWQSQVASPCASRLNQPTPPTSPNQSFIVRSTHRQRMSSLPTTETLCNITASDQLAGWLAGVVPHSVAVHLEAVELETRGKSSIATSQFNLLPQIYITIFEHQRWSEPKKKPRVKNCNFGPGMGISQSD